MRPFRVDKFKLDEEAEDTPQDFGDSAEQEEKYAGDALIAKAQWESLQEKYGLEVRSMDIQELNEKYKLNLKGLTEATIAAIVNQIPEVQEKKMEYLRAKRAAGTWKAKRRAYEKKYGMIDTLSYLHNSGWFMKDSHTGERPIPQRTSGMPSSLLERAKKVGAISENG
jgi:hypothetical protein